MQILFLGDSLTRGYDVPYGQGWVELLEKNYIRTPVIMPAWMVPAYRRLHFCGNDIARSLLFERYG